MLPVALKLAGMFAPQLIQMMTNNATAGTVAAQVVDIAKTVAGVSDPEEAARVIEADPEKAVQFKLAVVEQETDLERAYLADRQGARDRDIAMRAAGQQNMRADFMVVLDVIGLIACLVSLVFFKDSLPPEAVGLISTIAATFGLCLRDAHNFEFGSSRGSRNKDLR